MSLYPTAWMSLCPSDRPSSFEDGRECDGALIKRYPPNSCGLKIINNLASGHPERTVVVVRKLGDFVLPQIMPVLRNTLRYGDETRNAVYVSVFQKSSNNDARPKKNRFFDSSKS